MDKTLAATVARRLEVLADEFGCREELAEVVTPQLAKLIQSLERLDELGLDEAEPVTTFAPGEA